MTRPTIVFDVNETLLDLASLDGTFEEILGVARARSDWFRQVLQLTLFSNVVEDYADFGTLGRHALVMTAQHHERELKDADIERIVGMIRRLPPHADVAPALARLHDAGFRIATLTNSPLQVLSSQIENAGLGRYFEKLLSVDTVRVFKPSPATYRYAAHALGIHIRDLLLVAAHGWDVSGAIRAGARAAFLARPGQMLIPGEPVPEIVADTLGQVVDMLVRRFP